MFHKTIKVDKIDLFHVPRPYVNVVHIKGSDHDKEEVIKLAKIRGQINQLKEIKEKLKDTWAAGYYQRLINKLRQVEDYRYNLYGASDFVPPKGSINNNEDVQSIMRLASEAVASFEKNPDLSKDQYDNLVGNQAQNYRRKGYKWGKRPDDNCKYTNWGIFPSHNECESVMKPIEPAKAVTQQAQWQTQIKNLVNLSESPVAKSSSDLRNAILDLAKSIENMARILETVKVPQATVILREVNKFEEDIHSSTFASKKLINAAMKLAMEINKMTNVIPKIPEAKSEKCSDIKDYNECNNTNISPENKNEMCRYDWTNSKCESVPRSAGFPIGSPEKGYPGLFAGGNKDWDYKMNDMSFMF